MDIYGNKVNYAVSSAPVRVAKVTQIVDVGAIDIGRLGCLACTSGDSPLFDQEQLIFPRF